MHISHHNTKHNYFMSEKQKNSRPNEHKNSRPRKRDQGVSLATINKVASNVTMLPNSK